MLLTLVESVLRGNVMGKSPLHCIGPTRLAVHIPSHAVILQLQEHESIALCLVPAICVYLKVWVMLQCSLKRLFVSLSWATHTAVSFWLHKTILKACSFYGFPLPVASNLFSTMVLLIRCPRPSLVYSFGPCTAVDGSSSGHLMIRRTYFGWIMYHIYTEINIRISVVSLLLQNECPLEGN